MPGNLLLPELRHAVTLSLHYFLWEAWRLVQAFGFRLWRLHLHLWWRMLQFQLRSDLLLWHHRLTFLVLTTLALFHFHFHL
jgi:hypothetical protein